MAEGGAVRFGNVPNLEQSKEGCASTVALACAIVFAAVALGCVAGAAIGVGILVAAIKIALRVSGEPAVQNAYWLMMPVAVFGALFGVIGVCIVLMILCVGLENRQRERREAAEKNQ